jgi:hypothetical protein
MINIFINQLINSTSNVNINTFENVYVLLNTNGVVPRQFYYLEVSDTLFEQVSKNLIIYKVSKDILNIISHKYNSVIISKDDLLRYNIFNYELNESNLVIPILNVNFNDIKNYLDQFNNNNRLYLLKNIYNFIMLNTHFKIDVNNFKLFDMINNVNFSKFWLEPKNFSINNNEINYSKIHGYDDINKRGYDDINKCGYEDINKRGYEDINKRGHDDINKKNKYDDNHNNIIVDGYDEIYKTQNKITFLENDNTIIEDINKEDIYVLFSQLNNKFKFLLFCNLLVSYSYCHLVINNYKVLELMKKYLNEPKFNKFIRYIFGYTWLKLYLDEVKGILSNNMFNINTASILPRFTFCQKNYRNNPYMPIIDESMDYISGVNANYTNGINNLNEFKKSLNIYCCNNINNNIFDNINFKEFNMVICGSAIPACSQKEPLLMELFNDKTLHNYYSEYYSNSDVDIMFLVSIDNNQNNNNFIIDNYNIQFIDKVKKVSDKINNNICSLNSPYAEQTHNKLICNKLVKLYLPKEIIFNTLNANDEIKNKTKQELYKYLNENDNNKLLLPIYEKLYNEKLLLINKNDYIDYPELFEEHTSFRVCISNKINIDINFKFYITSPYINHKLELFCIKNINKTDTFDSIIAKFHLPCVRGYYDGDNVYMTPSCISSYITNMNIDYKASHYNIDNIIIKYHMRGFGTYMKNTRKRKIKTLLQTQALNKLYNNSSFNYYNLEEMFTNKIYKPRLYLPDLYTECDYIDTQNRYKKYKNIKPIVLNNEDYILHNQVQLRTIDDNNNICKLKKWVIDLYINEFDYLFEEVNNKKYKEIKNELINGDCEVISDSDNDI